MGKSSNITIQKKLQFKAEKKAQRKELKAKLKANRAKLLIKNLPFKSTEDNLKNHFSQYGDVENVNLLKKPDGKLVGCAFVQFKIVQHAAQAKHYLNGKPFLGRELTVDFAKPKSKYKKEKKKPEAEVKQEDPDLSIVKIEDIKEEVVSGDEAVETDKKEIKAESENSSSESDSDESEDFDNKNFIEDIKSDVETKPRVISNDVSEGKTIFIKNVPFDATNEDLKECLSQFGPLYYALVCVDKITDHSKGTAFVKFKNKDDADKCLEAGTELQLLGNILDCHPALSRSDIQQKQTEKNKKPSDSRNLYLVKEGVILAGTKAAEGVSATDMAKRLQLEQYKTQMLRNLNMFVSRTRVVVHNLPASWNDSKLRELLKKHSGPNAVIKQAKVMRDMRNLDAEGNGKSKEFGFVEFTSHEDALKALRSLNNNPNVFSEHRRPIVAFSIENKSMVKGRERRLELSRLKNPKCKDYNPNFVKRNEEQTNQGNNKRKFNNQGGSEERSEFSGVAARPGIGKMRSRYKLKTQAKLHYENMKKEKKKMKQQPKTLKQKREEFTKQERQKVKRKVENDGFSKMVNKYKQNLMSAEPSKKAKWYD